MKNGSTSVSYMGDCSTEIGCPYSGLRGFTQSLEQNARLILQMGYARNIEIYVNVLSVQALNFITAVKCVK
jgi:hypothetical protein